jgi:hypothetical protein
MRDLPRRKGFFAEFFKMGRNERDRRRLPIDEPEVGLPLTRFAILD